MDEENENIYFEFQLHKQDLTNSMTLEITDFSEPEVKGDAIALWESQIDEMKRKLGVWIYSLLFLLLFEIGRAKKTTYRYNLLSLP